jgi:hypothetical protein
LNRDSRAKTNFHNQERKMEVNEFDRDMTAAAFAEAGEHETAKKILSQGERKQPAHLQAPKKKPVLGMVVFGAVSLALYYALLTNQKLVMDVFTRGGVYTAWPILTAFVFSFIHGAFASNLLSVLGLEAKKH